MKKMLPAAIAVNFALCGGAFAADGACCDSACLNKITNAYFASLAAHDAKLLPFSRTGKFTLGGVPSAPGGGLWESAGPVSYRLVATDLADQSVAIDAVIAENGRPVILFARLHIDGRVIDQLETVIVRRGEGQMSNPGGLGVPPAIYEAIVPEALRVTRVQMIADASAYFDALAASGTASFKPAPLADDLTRVENGIQTTGRSRDGGKPPTVNDELRKGFGPPGGPRPSLVVSDRRFPVVDEEHGIVVAIGTMNLDLPPGTADFPGAHTVPNPHRKQTLIEFFKISGGLVRQIQATMYDRDNPKYLGSGW